MRVEIETRTEGICDECGRVVPTVKVPFGADSVMMQTTPHKNQDGDECVTGEPIEPWR